MTENAYRIDTDSGSDAAAALVAAFKAQNPGVGEFRATCADGSTIVIKIGKRHASEKAAPK